MMRICVIDAASQLEGVPSPSGGTLGRSGMALADAARGPERLMFRNETPAPELPQHPSRTRAPRDHGVSPVDPSAGARAAVGRDSGLILLSDATARYDDLKRWHLGNVLFEDGRTVIAIFGSKRNRGGARKPAALPAAAEPGSGAACSWTRCGALWL